MPKTDTIKSKDKEYSRIRKFLTIVFKMTLLFILFSTLFVGAYVYMNQKGKGQSGDNQNGIDNNENNIGGATQDAEQDGRLNTLLVGVDKDGTRTDVMLLASLDFKTKKIAVISLPRDTKVRLSPSMLDAIRSINPQTPRSGVMKLNEIHHYAYPKGLPYLRGYLQEVTGMQIDHYVKVDFKAFRKIIDEIGGVNFDVPMNMYYNDPLQDLHINLKKGKQRLNGEEAEQLVRFRSGYAEGDLGRIKVQQQFMQEAIKQVLSLGNIFKMPAILKILEEDVDTDFKAMQDGIRYSKYITSLDVNHIITKSLPGEPQTQHGVSYYIADEEATKELLQNMFNAAGSETSLEDGKPENPTQEENSSKALKVEILNGTQITGLASAVKATLEQKGYEVSSVGNYNHKGISTTVVQAASQSEGKRVAKDLRVGEVITEVDADVSSGTIRIVLGEDAAFLK